MAGRPNLARLARLMEDGPWEGLPPRMAETRRVFLDVAAERGIEKGILTEVARRLDTTAALVFAALNSALERAARWDALHQRTKALKKRGAKLLPDMEAVEVSDRFDGAGNLTGFAVRQRPRAKEGLATEGEALPGFTFSRVSTLYGREGERLAEWQIQRPEDVERIGAIRAFVAGLMEAVPPAAPIAPPSVSDSDLLCVYPMGDPHFGMRAHAPEAGENYDLKRAEIETRAVVDRLVSLAPPGESALLINLGDFFHADDNSARTRQSGNPLDVDGRWHQVVKVGAWTMVHLVQRLLEKHRRVTVWNERGNHDDHSAITLATALQMYFAQDPRVEIADPAPYYHFLEFGSNLIGATHGDGPKEAELPAIMAHDMPEAWGRTRHRVFHRGHFHHDRVVDLTGCTVETHRTLAASDAWHRKSGYRARRDMKCIVYHRRWGEDTRIRVNLDRLALEERAAA